MKQEAVIIGAGFGSLSCAVTLAAAGWKVTVLERQKTLGGKLQRVEAAGYRFDRGPSTITMPEAFSALYGLAGKRMEDYVRLYELEPRSRNIFADGTVVDLSRDPALMEQQIAVYSESDARAYRPFLAEAGRMRSLSERLFLNRLLLDRRDKLSPQLAAGFAAVRPLRKLDTLLRRYFRHPHTLAMFGRYATYVGSSPYAAPSVFAMLPSLEAEGGVYGVEGGTYRLVEGLAGLARELGVDIVTDAEATSIFAPGGRAEGVETTRGFYPARTVIGGGDVLSLNRLLIPEAQRPRMSDRKIAAYEPSLSGYVLMAGVRRRYEALLHHTVFFPETYEHEFYDIFAARRPPRDPAVYICHSGYSEPGAAPEGGSNLFILANAPYLSGETDWARDGEAYADKLLATLEARGIGGLHGSETLMHYTPQNLADDTLSHRGAIYGISSNTPGQAFFRPGNRSSDIKGLWYVGGTTHPGGGTPVVSLSGRLVGERIARSVR